MSDETKVHAALNPEVLAALDDWIAREPDPKPTREAAVTLAVCEWLAAQRLVPPDACSNEAA